MKLDKRDLWIIFLFLSLILTFFGQVLFTESTYIFRDFYTTIYPTRYFVSQCIKEGYLPLWNPYLYYGYPFFASLQHGLLNPFSLFIYLFPFDIGIKLFIVWHFFLAGLSMYLLMRELGITYISSLIASLVYTFNSYMLSIDTFTHLTSACWTPFIFLFYNMAINSLKLKYIFLTSISLSLQFAGEEPTILYATLITLFLFTIVKIISFKVGERKTPLFILPLIGLISTGLVFIQLIPFIETLTSSYRVEQMSYSQVVKWSLPPLELFTLILPISSGYMEFIFLGLGQGVFKGIYLGIVPFFLILVSLCEKSRKNLFWFGIFLIGIILSLGEYTPFYNFLYKYFPLFSMHRYPVKFYCISIFAGSILAGFGFEFILKKIRENGIKPIIILFISNIFLISILCIWYFNLNKILWVLKTHYFIPQSIEKLIEIEGKYFMIYQNFLLITIIFSLFNILIILAKRYIKLSIFATGSLIIIVFDLFFFGLNLNPLGEQKLYHQKPPILRILKKDQTYFRFMIEPKTLHYYWYPKGKTLFEITKQLHLSLIPNLCLMDKMYEADGYGFLILADYVRFYGRLRNLCDHNLLNLSNVKYIISKFDIPTLRVKLVFKEKKYNEEFRLYKNPNCLPHAFFVPKARIIKDRQEILNILTSKDFDPKKEVILEEEIQSKMQNTTTHKRIARMQNVKIVDYQLNKIIINTTCDADGFLFLSDTYYPGWKAYIDGMQTKIYRANFLFRAITLPMGIHKVEFIYSPLSFKIGIIGSLFTLIVLIGIGIWKYVKK